MIIYLLRGRSRKNFEVADGNKAQDKFGGAKSISSDAFFGKYDADVSMASPWCQLELYMSMIGRSASDLCMGTDTGAFGRFW